MGQFVDFSGLWVPLVTPFQGERVDIAALQRLVGHLAQTAIKGFVVCGSTGEAESLTRAEQLAVLDAVLASCRDKPVMMGLAGTRLDEMREHLREVARRPVVAVLVSAPYYLRPAQAGIVAHFRALADASPVPVVLYDVPSRTGSQMTLDTLLTLAAHPNIRAIKDCGGDEEKTRALIADGRLAVLAGDDHRIFTTACLGGAGAIAASGHLLPQHYAQLVASAREGRLADARRLCHALTPLSLALFAEPNPSVFKAVLARQGWMGDALRAPHSQASVEAVQRAWAALEAAERALAS
ncbi:MAG: 4-hydroxy-tetrahydrodipicolinate synthase [Rhizobacter sp.]|nr:4-hydroxy-tetrahydrodipicolinate synthase [Rhizobacter sp.]